MCNINEVVKVNPALSSARLPDSTGTHLYRRIYIQRKRCSEALRAFPSISEILRREKKRFLHSFKIKWKSKNVREIYRHYSYREFREKSFCREFSLKRFLERGGGGRYFYKIIRLLLLFARFLSRSFARQNTARHTKGGYYSNGT